MPLVGESRIQTYVATHAAATAITSVSLSVTEPDGTPPVPVPTLSGETGSVASHTLTALVAFPQGGVYELLWTWTETTGGEVRRVREIEVALWTDVWASVRDLLQRTSAQLSDAAIDLEIAYVLPELVAAFSCIDDAGGYNALTGASRRWFDEALAYLVAARRLPSVFTLSGGGQLKRKKEGDTDYTYTDTGGASLTQIQSDYAGLASSAMSRIACVAEAEAAEPFVVFGLAGPRRARETYSGYSRLLDIVNALPARLGYGETAL